MTTVLVSGADDRYGYWLLNLIGSVHANSPVFDRIVVYDLGLTRFQHRLAGAARDVELRTVPPFVPHWKTFFTWKPWIWTHLEADEVLWLDAGTTVLRPLTEIVDEIRCCGYFLVSQRSLLRDILPRDYFELYGIPEAAGEREYVAAGVIGFARGGDFFDRVIRPTYEDCLRGLNLGFSIGEREKWNWGMHTSDSIVVRNCPRFRHDQSVLNANLVKATPGARMHDLFKYAGPRSPRDHPDQLIWHHRRRGDFAYLPRARYSLPLAPLAKAWGLWFRYRWLVRNHSWLFRPGTYLRKAKRAATEFFSP